MTASDTSWAKNVRHSAFGIRNESIEGVKHFTQLDAWKLSYELMLLIYKWTKGFPTEERYGLTSQMRRAAVSILSNIAEGFGRFHWLDKRKFYINARSSTFEIEAQIYACKGLSLLSEEQSTQGTKLCERIKKTMNGLIRKMNDLSNADSRMPNSDSQSL
jgi:four helix bundle protein